MQRQADLHGLLHPNGVALLGSVDREADPASLRARLADKWGDPCYLVNRKGGAIGDIRVYRSVGEIDGQVDLAVISVAAALVPEALEECGRRRIPHALVFTSGFSEVGPEGAELERRLGEIAQRYGIRVLGPNTNMNAFERMPEVPSRKGGKIGLVTQSGGLGRPVIQGASFGIGFSRWVPTGNEVDIDVADVVEYFASDEQTQVIAGYFEGFRDAKRLRRALEAANAARKPLVALKIGRTPAGVSMATSHTGHLAGSDAVVDGLFRQYGVTRVGDLDELLETAALFAKVPARTGPNVCLYSSSGGSGTLMTEIAGQCGVAVPALSQETQAAIHRVLPGYLAVRNPVDNGGFAGWAPSADRRRVLELIAADPAVDILVVGLTAPVPSTDSFAEDVCWFAKQFHKPVVVTWNSLETDHRGFKLLVESGVPMFRSFRNCFRALQAFADYQRRSLSFRRRELTEAPLPDNVASVMAAAGPLTTAASRQVLTSFGIPVVREEIAASASDAGRAAAAMGFPVVMKLISPDFPHKTDAGLVRLGISSVSQAQDAYEQLCQRAAGAIPQARIEGVLIQEHVADGTEMIVGVTQDPVLGPAVMVGTGGIFAELLSDVAVRPLPIDRADAAEMVSELKGFSLLRGARGRPEQDVEALIEVVMSVARMATACGASLRELDLNPVLVRRKGAVAVDHLVVGAERV